MRDAVEQVLSMQQAQMSSHGIQVEVKGPELEIQSYKSEVQQVLLNLISTAKDAFKASQVENKQIKIVLEQGKVRVQGNAGGVPDSVVSRIFEPYFTTKKHGEGRGGPIYV